jgi:NAD(P)-dependent dehydrogenase (short-subunit alcohol dehydrogenase family)
MTAGVLITGAAGGLGSSLMNAFAAAGWTVVGADLPAPSKRAPMIDVDLGDLCADPAKLAQFAADVRSSLAGRPLKALINNAAVQILGSAEDLSNDDMLGSMTVNAVAPFVLVKAFLSDLRAARGSVVNIGSVHAQATKPRFAAYAASKAALHGLTRALAVDLAPQVRVNTLAPAAIGTAMLKQGFADDPAALAALSAHHPLGRIADPAEIARLALFLASDESAFLTGATIYADGGVLSRLHDPA